MLFNSIDFAVFLPIIYLLYWLVFNRNVTLRNAFLMIASYVFYSFWDWRFVSLLIFSSFADYLLGLGLTKYDNQQRKRKLLLYCSLAINFGILGFFKYYNFFVDSFVSAFTFFGKHIEYQPLRIILPVGVSFYTFQSLTYIIGIYQRKIEPTNKVIQFLAYVSFFPQLVAGPIERAQHFLPQFSTKKVFNYQEARSGLLLIVFGLFKKLLIADKIAIFINSSYSNIPSADGITMTLAILFFAFQLYFDFSAYSDIAIGTARLLGFELMLNFRRPYLSKSFSEFWTRWHISLSSWFRDYLYIPLGGNRKGTSRTAINVMIVFLLSGLWHGASWNFVIWGGLNGLFLVFFDKWFKLPQVQGVKQIFSTLLVVLSWTISLVFFRAHTFYDAIEAFKSIGFSNSSNLYHFGLNRMELLFVVVIIVGMMLYEFYSERFGTKMQHYFYNSKAYIRWGLYLFLVLMIVYLGTYGSANDNTFIYFQF